MENRPQVRLADSRSSYSRNYALNVALTTQNMVSRILPCEIHRNYRVGFRRNFDHTYPRNSIGLLSTGINEMITKGELDD